MGGTGRLRGKSFGLFGRTRHGPLKRTRHGVVGRRKHRPFRRRKHWPFEKRRYAIHLATYANAYGFLLESQQSMHGMDEYGMESSEIEAKKGGYASEVLEVKTMNLDGVRKEQQLRLYGVQRNHKKKPKRVWGPVLGDK
ncbi:hypothetical protein Tco_0434617 [Tanacetum coccineum]